MSPGKMSAQVAGDALPAVEELDGALGVGLEGAASRAGELSERTRIEPFEPFGDGAVEFAEREERAVSQRGEDPALDHLHADFNLGLVNYLQMQAVPPDGMTFVAPA